MKHSTNILLISFIALISFITSTGAFLLAPACNLRSLRVNAGVLATQRHTRTSRLSNLSALRRQDIEGMRAAEIKEQLFKRGISYAGLYEKSELVDKLSTAMADEFPNSESSLAAEALASALCELGSRLPLSRLRPREGTLGDDVRIDEKDYYAVKAVFPDLNVEADFILDTAASNSVCTPQFSRGTTASRTGVTASVTGGTGGAGGFEQLRLGNLKIRGSTGMLACGNLDAVVLEVPVPASVGGLLGLDLLSRFDVYVDFEGSEPQAVFMPTLTACSSDSSAPTLGSGGSRGRAVESLRQGGLQEAPLFYLPPPAGLYYCKVQLQSGDKKSQAISAIVDMGSTFTILNTQAVRALGITDTSPLLRETNQVVSGVAMPGAGYIPVKVREIDARIRIGGMTGKGGIDMGTHSCAVADLAAFSQLGLAGEPGMILGLDVLAGHPRKHTASAAARGGRGGGKLVLSVAGRRLWLCPALS